MRIRTALGASVLLVALASPSLAAPWIGSPDVSIDWPGLPVGSATAVDPHGAVGPVGILEVANQGISYYQKSGALSWRTSETSFLFANTCCDAKAIYDTDTNRFFVIAQATGGGQLHVAVSTNPNPTLSAWQKWTFNTPVTVDYPGIGIDEQALYVTYNFNRSWFVLKKSDLVLGTVTAATMSRVDVGSTGSQGLQAVSVIGSEGPGDVAYCVNMTAPTNIRLYAISDVLGARTLTTFDVASPSYGSGTPDYAPQSGTTTRLNNAFPVVMGNAFWREGDLWFCNNVASGSQPTRTVTRWYRVETNGWPAAPTPGPSLAEWGDLDGGPNVWSMHPAIGGNERGDVCLVFTRSSSSTFPSIRSAVRRAGETSFQEVLVRTSAGPFTIANQGTFNGQPAARWADYCVVTPDPVDHSFWVSHLTLTATDTVSTWWANVTRDETIYVDRSYVGVENGSYLQPFNTVVEAHTAASGGEALLIRPGPYPEAPPALTLDKNVRLENPYSEFTGGTVRIGP